MRVTCNLACDRLCSRQNKRTSDVPRQAEYSQARASQKRKRPRDLSPYMNSENNRFQQRPWRAKSVTHCFERTANSCRNSATTNRQWNRDSSCHRLHAHNSSPLVSIINPRYAVWITRYLPWETARSRSHVIFKAEYHSPVKESITYLIDARTVIVARRSRAGWSSARSKWTAWIIKWHLLKRRT